MNHQCNKHNILSVGFSVGFSVGISVGFSVGLRVELCVFEGFCVGTKSTMSIFCECEHNKK